MMRKLLAPLFLSLAWLASSPSFAASDTFTGGAGLLSAHDSNWFQVNTGGSDTLANFSLDGSGFLVVNSTFKTPDIGYTGTDATQKSEIVVPIGAFATLPGADDAGVLICAGTSNRGFEALVGSGQLTGQVVNAVRIASNGSFVTSQTLSPTIDTTTVALTMSLQRTSTTNINLVVNGTTYPINTTGVDITSGVGGLFSTRTGTTTIKIDSWTNGVSGSSVFNPLSGRGAGAARPVTFNRRDAANDDEFLLRAYR